MGRFTKGNNYGYKHGYTKTRLHNIWKGMRYRCNNKDYKGYGNRNISICPEWDDFEVFKEWALNHGYKDDLTIERKDVNGNYCPENCEWIPNRDQGNNTTRSTYLTAFGETKRLTRWLKDERCKVNITTLRTRLDSYKWDIEKALSTPCKKPYIEYNNQRKTVTEWSKEFNIPKDTLWYRLFRAKWPVEKALNTPVRKG